MSEKNVEIVRSMWKPFREMDVTKIDWDSEAIREGVEQLFSPDVELRWSTTGPEARVYRGKVCTTTDLPR